MSASKVKSEVVVIPLGSIHPDEDQPRKSFPADKMNDLMQSIEKHGLMTPLHVTHRPEGGYKLVDGERRFRASTELKLKEVPVIVMDEMDDNERLIKQFHLQEQHLGWTGAEKAMALQKLSRALGLDMDSLGKLVGINDKTLKIYVSFADIIDKESFQRNEIPLKFTPGIQKIKAAARNAYEKLEKEYSDEESESLEAAIIYRTKEGELKVPHDLSKIVDMFRNDPLSVDKFLKSKKDSIRTIYHASSAEARTSFRQFVYAVSSLRGRLDSGRAVKFETLFGDYPSARTQVKKMAEDLTLLAREIA